MALKDIMSISGKGGLYKFISQSRNGIIVESLIDKKRTHVPTSAKISALEDIAIFTDTAEVQLNDVFKSIHDKEDGGKAIDPKSSQGDALKGYMEGILPDYDRDRVYVSDLKKVFTWYNLLHDLDMISFEEEEESDQETEEIKSKEDTDSLEEKKEEGKKEDEKIEDEKKK